MKSFKRGLRSSSSQQQDVAMAPFSRILHWVFFGSFISSVTAGMRTRHCGGSIRHVHLAVGHDPATEMTVSFSSHRSTHAPVVGGVWIGIHPDRLSRYVEEPEPARYYNATPLQERDGHYYSPYIHHVRVSDLEPSTTYYYQCFIYNPANNDTRVEDMFGKGTRTSVLRGNYDGKILEAELEPYEEQNREAEILHSDGASRGSAIFEYREDRDMDGGHQRRHLDLIYYDSSKGACPSPDKIRSFQTAPSEGLVGSRKSRQTGEPSLRFAYVGDMGQFVHSAENLEHLVAHQEAELNAIILAGDIAYTGNDNRRWDTFFDFMDDFFFIDGVPMHVVAGNHDIEKQANGTDIFLAYEHRFRMPQVKRAELGSYNGPLGLLNMDHPPYPLPYDFGNSFYAHSYGISRHIFLNAYSSMEPDSQQYQWLQKELLSVDRTKTPWVILTIHVPLYNTFDLHRHDPQILAAKKHLEPLLVQYNVNLVVGGHVHAYQRTKTVAFDKTVPSGPVHMIVGAGGRQCKGPFQSVKGEEWNAVRDATHYGYGILEIFNKTHARWEWIITGKSEYQDMNMVSNTTVTLPPINSSDVVILENQYFLDR